MSSIEFEKTVKSVRKHLYLMSSDIIYVQFIIWLKDWYICFLKNQCESGFPKTFQLSRLPLSVLNKTNGDIKKGETTYAKVFIFTEIFF